MNNNQKEAEYEALSRALNNTPVTVRGTIRSIGSMPFTEIVISDNDDNDWFVSREDRALLEEYRGGGDVTVRGTAFIDRLILADGVYVGIRRRLLHITIIK